MLPLLATAALGLVFLCAVFYPLEIAFPAKPQCFFRSAWFTDLCFFLGQYLFWGGMVLGILIHLKVWLAWVVAEDFRLAVAGQPWWLQAMEVILLSDFFSYWGHRLQHRIGFLWRFHAVHHSSEQLDWLAAHREHPVDAIYTMTLINLPPMILGFPLETIAGFLLFRGVWAVFIHANVRLPIGPLRMLLGSPELHHWHHARERDVGNYANVCPLMDILLGTYCCPPQEPEQFGLKEPISDTYLGLIIKPLLAGGGSNASQQAAPHGEARTEEAAQPKDGDAAPDRISCVVNPAALSWDTSIPAGIGHR
jgi:sterol desaturase/sphingolipid hydroxylase (fatty acid hydroxylase superfamily)